MDIVLTYPGGLGGGHVWLYDFAGRLAERGHSVRLYTVRRKAPLGPPPAPNREYPSDVEVLPVDGVLFGEHRTMAHRVARDLSDRPADVIVSTAHEARVLADSRLPGAPVHVATFHHTYPDYAGFRGVVSAALGVPSRKRVARLYDRWKAWQDISRIREANILVCASEHQYRRAVTGFGVPMEKATVVPLGIDTEKFRPSELTLDNPTILFTGGAQPNKGLSDLLRALNRADYRGIRLAVAGDADGQATRLAQREATNRVTVQPLGYLSATELAGVYRRSAIFVTPTYHESFGLATAEAMASGLPVVAYDIPPVRELVQDGRHGHLVTPGDVLGLSDAVVDLLKFPSKARRMGKAGRRRVEKRYAWPVVMKKWEKLFSSIVDTEHVM